MSVSVAGNPKNRCRTTVAERMVETELPFIGHQVLQERLVRENPALNKPFLRKTINCVLTFITLRQYREILESGSGLSRESNLSSAGVGVLYSSKPTKD